MPIERFTKDEFEKALANISSEFRAYFYKSEWHYQWQFTEKGLIKVNSSIGATEVARDTGEDSIRVWIVYDGKPLKKSRRWITRVSGWQDRLHKAVHGAVKEINDLEYSPKCPHCGGDMVLRSGVHGKFYGCLSFPKCRGTRNYEELPAEMEWLLQ